MMKRALHHCDILTKTMILVQSGKNYDIKPNLEAFYKTNGLHTVKGIKNKERLRNSQTRDNECEVGFWMGFW